MKGTVIHSLDIKPDTVVHIKGEKNEVFKFKYEKEVQ